MSLSYVLPCCGAHLRASQSLRLCSWTGDVRLYGQTFLQKRVRAQPLKFETTPLRSPPRALLSGGGILGVGPSEIVVIVAVGWLLLGPEKLYQLARDSGKLIGELRKSASAAREEFSDALELDVLASEVQRSAKSRDILKEDVKVDDQLTDTTAVGNGTVKVEESLKEQSSGNSEFLDQLRRVSDPNQVAPTEVPDLSVEIEELEVERLEREYQEAKRRLELRKQQSSSAEASTGSTSEEQR